MSRKSLLTAIIALTGSTALQVSIAAALPVVPGATGYGMDTPAGRGGTVYRVTNLNESGTGSLKACVLASGPRVCVFEVSGTIRLTSEIEVWNPYLTVAGQTAPSPGIMVRGAPLVILASDVLVQHIRFRAGDDPNGPPGENRDSLSVSGPSAGGKVRNVVFDHNSIEWAVDELSNVWGFFDNITLNNNIFAEALNDSIHPQGPHGYGPILGGDDAGNVSMAGNLFAHTEYRNPASRARNFVFVNNVIYNRANGDISLSSDFQNNPTTNSIVGNVFLKGPDYKWAIQPIFIDDQSSSTSWPTGSTIYAADNVSDEPYSGSSIIGRYTGTSFTSSLRTAPVAWLTGLVAKPTANNAVYDAVLANAGARPADRDAVDLRIIQSVKSRTGQIINCVSADGSSRCAKNGGGWPVIAQKTRALTLPANPNAVAANGYTNLENWLHAYSDEVEGKGVIDPLPPSNLVVE
ncbi:MAG: pectate lyase [Steroidobacteraceae bacterium]